MSAYPINPTDVSLPILNNALQHQKIDPWKEQQFGNAKNIIFPTKKKKRFSGNEFVQVGGMRMN